MDNTIQEIRPGGMIYRNIKRGEKTQLVRYERAARAKIVWVSVLIRGRFVVTGKIKV